MKICVVCGVCVDNAEPACHDRSTERPYSTNVIDGYRLERRIFSVGKIADFEARHLEYDRPCTIRIIEGDADRFLADASVATGFIHPAVSPVIESGKTPEGVAYAVSDIIDPSSTLQSAMNNGSLSPLDQIVIARRSAEAISALHRAGLLHGDLRPANISLIKSGSDIDLQIHNLDLGSAVAESALANRFSMASAVDVIRYYPPERLRKEDPGKTSDVYCLGLILYELLSGRPPFTAETAPELVDQHLNHRPPEITIANFDLRMLLTHTISEALQKQPSFRQATADLFARQMRHIEQLATHVSTPAPAIAAVSGFVSRESQARQPLPPPQQSVPILVTYSADRMVIENAIPPASLSDIAAIEPEDLRVGEPVQYVPTAGKRSRLNGARKRIQSRSIAVQPAAEPKTLGWVQPEDDIPSQEDVQNERLMPLENTHDLTIDGELLHLQSQIPSEDLAQTKLEMMIEPLEADHPPLTASAAPSVLLGMSMDAQVPSFLTVPVARRDLSKIPILALGGFAALLLVFGMVQLSSALAEDRGGGYIGEQRASEKPVSVPAPSSPAPERSDESRITTIPARALGVPVENAPSPRLVPARAESTSTKAGTSGGTAAKISDQPAKSSQMTARRKPAEDIDPFVPSTIVITRGGKRATIESNRPSTAAKKNAGSGATRPRIVKVPE